MTKLSEVLKNRRELDTLRMFRDFKHASYIEGYADGMNKAIEITTDLEYEAECEKKMEKFTNRKWLNSLSDEEYLETLIQICANELICEKQHGCKQFNGLNACYDCQLDWLKKERNE